MKELLNKLLPTIPADIHNNLDQPKITITPLEKCNLILVTDALQNEVGYSQFPDGSWLVSMNCPMPGITKAMIEWWFWWHCQDDLRYPIWFPVDHISIQYHKKDRAYFRQSEMPPFQPNSQYPVEKIGGAKMPLRIDFVTPEQFGFSGEAMRQGKIATIVCGHVSACTSPILSAAAIIVRKNREYGVFSLRR